MTDKPTWDVVGPELALVLAWFYGLIDERPHDIDEQMPLARAAVRLALARAERIKES